MWSDGRFLEVVPHRDPLKAAVAQPTPRGWAFPGLDLAEFPVPPDPPVMGLL